MLDKQLIASIASRRTALLCIEEPSEGEDVTYYARLKAMLQQCGLNVVIMQPSDFQHSTPLLSVPPEDTFAISTRPDVAQMTSTLGMPTLGVSRDENLEGAALVLPDLHSLYAMLGWVLYSKHTAPGERVEIQKKVTVIIPAAGKGTRLGFDKPKILYPFDGVTALDIMYAKVAPIAEKIIIIASTEGEKLICEHLRARGQQAEISVDPEPYGTGGSVAVALDMIKGSETVLVIWGDQIGVPRDALKEIVFLHQKYKADFSLPSRLRKKPYIHLDRNEKGVVERVLRRRFNDAMPLYGENELGVFVLQGEVLKRVLSEMKERYWHQRKAAEQQGETVAELDFLDIIPEIASRNYTIITSPFIFDDAALGFNTVEEAQIHVQRLRQGAYL